MRTLTYNGLVNPQAGMLMGPSLGGRYWYVMGSMQHEGKTEVFLTDDPSEIV